MNEYDYEFFETKNEDTNEVKYTSIDKMTITTGCMIKIIIILFVGNLIPYLLDIFFK